MEELEVGFMEYDHDGELVCVSKNVCDAGSDSTRTKQEVLNNEPCLICSETTNDAWYRSFELLSGSEGCELLNEQIWSIFILRKLLDFPRQKCTTLMEETLGVSNPKTWFTLCGSCTDTVKSAMKVYLQILKLERDLSGFQHAVKNTIQETLKTDMDNQTKRTRKSGPYSENIVNIRTRIRSHFSEEVDKESIVPKQEFEEEEEDIFQESCATFEHLNPTRMNEDFCEDDDIERNYLYGQHSDSEYDNVRPKRSRMANVPSKFYGTEEEETEESFKSEGEISTAQMFSNISVDENVLTKKKWEGGYRKGKAIGRTRQRLLLDLKNRCKFCCKICGIKYTYLRSYKCHMIKHKNHRQKRRVRIPPNYKREIGATKPLDAFLTNTIKRKANVDEKDSEETEVKDADQMSGDYESSSSYVPSPSEGERDPLEPNDDIPQKKREYKCKRCHFVTKIWSKYKAHLVSQSHRSKKYKSKIQIDEMGKVVCEICGRRFLPGSSLSKHMARHRHNKELECPNCHFPCETRTALEKHVRYNHCERSNENYEQAKNERLQKMLAEQHKSVHDCELCERRFGTFGSFKKHMWDHKNFKETTCPKCHFPCLSKSALESHLKYKRCFISTATKTTYNCDYCSYGTTQRRYFEIHCCEKKKTIHNVSLSSNLNETDTREMDRQDVSQEDKDAKSVDQQIKDGNATGNKYQADSKQDCEICERSFRTIDSFRTHMQKHKNKKFECPKCRYPHRTAASLDRHLKRTQCGRSDQDNEYELNGGIDKQHGSVHHCQICGRSFQIKESFRCHMRRHKNKKEFECPKCRYPYRTAELLDRHLERSQCGKSDQDNEHEEEHQGSLRVCEICRRSFRTKYSFQSHMSKHKNKQFECPKCRYPYRTEKSLDRHLERNECGRSNQHNELDLNGLENNIIEKQQWLVQDCEICKRKFSSITSMKNHMWEHENCKDSTCPKCNYPCLSKSALESHLKLENCFKLPTASSKKITYKCEDCPYSTTNRSLFHNHIRRHKIYLGSQTSDGRWKCVQCNEIFHAQRPLAVHKREVHGSEFDMPAFRCSLCPKSYSKKSALINHIKEIHQKDFRFFCEVCGYGVNRKSQLEIHKRKHMEDKQCICELCGMRYRYPQTLITHMKKDHPGGRQAAGKEFKCKYCPDNVMTFSNKALLNDHLKNGHQDLYIHKCDQCDNSYMSLGSLQLHKKNSHTNNPAECQFCHKSFASPFNLYSHYGNKGGGCKKKPPDFKFSIPRKKLAK